MPAVLTCWFPLLSSIWYILLSYARYIDPRDPYNVGIAEELATSDNTPPPDTSAAGLDAGSSSSKKAGGSGGKGGGRRKARRPKSAGSIHLNESVSDLDRRYARYGGSLGGRLSTPQSLRWYHESMKKDESQHATVRRLRPLEAMKKSEAHTFVSGFVERRMGEEQAEKARLAELRRQEEERVAAEEAAAAAAKQEAEDEARMRRQLKKTRSGRSLG